MLMLLPVLMVLSPVPGDAQIRASELALMTQMIDGPSSTIYYTDPTGTMIEGRRIGN